MQTGLRLRYVTLTISLTVICAACGGGGSTDASPPPIPPPLVALAPLQLDESNAEPAAVVGLFLAGTTLQLAGLAAEAIEKVRIRAEGTFTESCPFGGTADYVHSDADQNGFPSAGDVIRVTYSDCLVSLFQQTGSGSFVITLEPASEASTIDDRFYSGKLDGRSLLLELTSVFDFDLHLGFLEEMHRVAGNVTFRLDDDGTVFTETLTDLIAVKHANFATARNEISISGTVHSEILNGRLQFNGNTTLSGILNTYPEQGRIEMHGAAGSRVAVTPYNVQGSTLATIAVDQGDATFVELAHRPFWTSLLPDFTWSYMPTNQQYIRPFDQADFWFIGSSPVRDEIASVNTSLRLQYSRELDISTVPDVVEIMRVLDEPPFIEVHEVATDIRGAAIILRPLQQYRHDSEYVYPLNGFNVSDMSGRTAYTCCGEFSTANNLSAIAKASPAFGVAGSTIGLDGRQSHSTGSSVVAYSWVQVSGQAGQLVNADQPTASIRLPAINTPDLLAIQLQVADGNGELEWDIAEVHAFASASDIGLLYFYGDEDEYVSLGREWFLSRAQTVMTVERDIYNGIWVNFASWNAHFVASDDVSLVEGTYENAVRYQTIGSEYPELSLGGDGRGCNTSIGRFEVLEVTYDTNGNVATAAIDFEQTCDESGQKLTGFLRIGSDIPFPTAL